MDNASLVSLSSQLAAYRSMDVIANNLANVSTPGFKRESVQFEQYVLPVKPAEDQKGSQSLTFVRDAGVVRDLTGGSIEQTSSPYDLAISGKGYFAVQTPGGERYTRNGHFGLNSEGIVVSSDGYPLLGEGGPITVTVDDGDISFGADGSVTGKQGQLAKVRMVDFADERALSKEGACLYATAQSATPAANAVLNQGMLESSNVQPVLEISRMIEVMRAYEATATLAKSADEMKRQAVQKLGTVQ
jgi:flagellar basal-body rod protein FlgF